MFYPCSAVASRSADLGSSGGVNGFSPGIWIGSARISVENAPMAYRMKTVPPTPIRRAKTTRRASHRRRRGLLLVVGVPSDEAEPVIVTPPYPHTGDRSTDQLPYSGTRRASSSWSSGERTSHRAALPHVDGRGAFVTAARPRTQIFDCLTKQVLRSWMDAGNEDAIGVTHRPWVADGLGQLRSTRK